MPPTKRRGCDAHDRAPFTTEPWPQCGGDGDGIVHDERIVDLRRDDGYALRGIHDLDQDWDGAVGLPKDQPRPGNNAPSSQLSVLLCSQRDPIRSSWTGCRSPNPLDGRRTHPHPVTGQPCAHQHMAKYDDPTELRWQRKPARTRDHRGHGPAVAQQTPKPVRILRCFPRSIGDDEQLSVRIRQGGEQSVRCTPYC